MKTTGIYEDGEKIGYRLEHMGNTCDCLRQGQEFVYCGDKMSLSRAKKEFLLDCEAPQEQPEEKPQTDGTWDCIHPAAWLAMFVYRVDHPGREDMLKTLDAYGYLKPDGEIDMDTVGRELERVAAI